MTDNTLASHYASLAITEGKISDQEATVRQAKESLAEFELQLAKYKADRRELHRLIAAKKKRPAKAAGDPAMPAALRRV